MQFTLQTLMITFVVVAAALAAFGVWGISLAVVCIGIAAYIRTSSSMVRVILIVGAIFLLCCARLLLPPVSNAREYTRCGACLNNLKQIGVPLHNYHDQHQSFPPAYIPDANGKPMHSWRVLILPFMECINFYQQYDFDEPWDGPNNKKLHSTIIHLYQCPSDAHVSGSANTSYVAVIGPSTVWPGKEGVCLADITDGTDSTLMIIGVENSGIHWMEPRDLTLEEIIADTKGKILRTPHRRRPGWFYKEQSYLNVAFADGSVNSLTLEAFRRLARSLATRNGEETIDFDILIAPELDWGRTGGLIVLVFAVLLLIFRPRRRRELQSEPSSNKEPESSNNTEPESSKNTEPDRAGPAD